MKNISTPLMSWQQVLEIIMMVFAAITVPAIIFIVGFPSGNIQSLMVILMVPAIYFEVFLFYKGLKKSFH